jgi:hypothetical protein
MQRAFSETQDTDGYSAVHGPCQQQVAAAEVGLQFGNILQREKVPRPVHPAAQAGSTC